MVFAPRKRKTIKARIDQTHADFRQLAGKLNRYKLKTEQAIDKACADILKANRTQSFFTYRIANEPITTYKNKHRGRPSKNTEPEKTAVVRDQFSVQTYQMPTTAFPVRLLSLLTNLAGN